MKTVGIITIHKIFNYGSVLQAYALQKACQQLGYTAEIIDYNFPNSFQTDNKFQDVNASHKHEPYIIKLLFSFSLLKQHRSICNFVREYHNLSKLTYKSPDSLNKFPPRYDVYVTGSDQLWNPKYTNADPAFFLSFAPSGTRKISYAASIPDCIPQELEQTYKHFLSEYNFVSIREKLGAELIYKLTGKEPQVVLDPTLLLDSKQWGKIATEKRIFKTKYILCYFLNYSFDSFPYVEQLADYFQNLTGLELVVVARPPHHLFKPHLHYRIAASPQDFLALIRDCEFVLTTSFHGTAFAVNFAKPVLSVVDSNSSVDSRQVNLLENLGLHNCVLRKGAPFPEIQTFHYDSEKEQICLKKLRKESISFLKKAISDEI